MPKRIFKDKAEASLLVVASLLFVSLVFVGIEIGEQFQRAAELREDDPGQRNVRVSVERIRSSMGETELAVKAYTLTKDEDLLDRYFDLSYWIIDEFESIYTDSLMLDSSTLACIKALDSIVFTQLDRLDLLVTYTDEYRVDRAMTQVNQALAVKKDEQTASDSGASEQRGIFSRFRRNLESASEDKESSTIKEVSSEVTRISQREKQREDDIRKMVLDYSRSSEEAYSLIDSISLSLASQEIVFHEQRLAQSSKYNLRARRLLILGITLASILVVISFILIIYQIRHVRRFTKATRQASAKALALASAKESFITKISHELRTPLNGIIGFGDLLNEVESEDQREEYIEKLMGSAIYLKELVNDLLDWSKMNRGKFSLELRDFSLPQVISDVEEMCEFRLLEGGPAFIVENNTKTKFLFGDDVRLKQVLINVVGNALKFTEQGTVKLNISEQQEEDVCQLRFSVSDTGPGISEEQLPSIFQEFEQVDVDVPNVRAGTGLGLSISKWIVEEMKGTIDIKSSKGEGTTVNIEIPFLQGKKPTRSQISRHIPDLSDKNVLIVDDNSFNLDLLGAILLKTSCRVFRASNGSEALSILQREQIDIGIFDLRMPGMSGIELVENIQPEQRKSMKIIALTAAATLNTRSKALSSGFDSVLIKPIDQAKLFDKLSGVNDEGQKEPNNPSESSTRFPDSIQTEQLDLVFGDDLEFRNEMLTSFVDHLEEECQRLSKAIDASDFKEVREVIHKLIPSCRQVGAFQMVDLLTKLRKVALSEGDLKDTHTKILSERDRTIEAINHILERS